MQKKNFKIFSKSLPSSNYLETLAELTDQLSGLDPRAWFQSITHNIGSGTIKLIIVLMMITFLVYQCLSTKIVQTKQTHLLKAFFTKVTTVILNYEKIKKGDLSGHIQL